MSGQDTSCSKSVGAGNEPKVVHFKVARFVFMCCEKLKLNPTTLASACVLYHRFYQECSITDYDPHTMAATAIFLATKVEEQHTRLRDVVNVCHRTLYPDKLLEIGEELYELKDTVASCELLLLRMLQFHVTCDHPHKYLVHYLKSLSQLFNAREWNRYTIAQTSWSILRDTYHGTICLDHRPPLVAVSCIALALRLCRVDVPMSTTCKTPWWKVFHESATNDEISKVIDDIVDLYDLDDKYFPN